MKYSLATLAAFTVAASAFAQGTVNFSNRIPGTVDARVQYDTGGGVLTPADGRFVAQLYASAPGGTLAAVGDPIVFRSNSDAAKGYWVGDARTIPGVAENGSAQVQVRAWATSLGSTYEAAMATGQGGIGSSATITVTSGGGLTPPQALVGLQGFTISTIVPEPSIAALGLLGAGLLLIRRKK